MCWRGASASSLRSFYRCRAGLSILLGVAVALYTGLFLSDLPAVAVWYTPLLPLLFLSSSLSCGLTCAPVVAYLAGEWQTLGSSLVRLVKIDAAVIVFEIVLVVLLVAAAFWGPSAGSAALARRPGLSWAALRLRCFGAALSSLVWCARSCSSFMRPRGARLPDTLLLPRR